jgi:lysine 2,3-aminomutase
VNNQSVLLRGINDSVETQLKLCQGLLKIKVRPYYLFQCDEVQGTEHLRTPVETGIKIIEGLRGHTSGLAIPTFVIDLPDGGGKVPLQPDYVLAKTGAEMIIRNYQGHLFRYRNPGAVQMELNVHEKTETIKTPDEQKQPSKVGAQNAGRASLRP